MMKVKSLIICVIIFLMIEGCQKNPEVNSEKFSQLVEKSELDDKNIELSTIYFAFSFDYIEGQEEFLSENDLHLFLHGHAHNGYIRGISNADKITIQFWGNMDFIEEGLSHDMLIKDSQGKVLVSISPEISVAPLAYVYNIPNTEEIFINDIGDRIKYSFALPVTLKSNLSINDLVSGVYFNAFINDLSIKKELQILQPSFP